VYKRTLMLYFVDIRRTMNAAGGGFGYGSRIPEIRPPRSNQEESRDMNALNLQLFHVDCMNGGVRWQKR